MWACSHVGSPFGSGGRNIEDYRGGEIITVVYFWKINRSAIPFAILRMALDRFTLKRNPNISFFKLLGCGHGESFLPTDADSTRWGLLLCIDESALERFDGSATISRWRSRSLKEFRVLLNPLAAHGKWSGKEPFNFRNEKVSDSQSVVAITRARIAWRQYPRFLSAIPPVSAEIKVAPGVLASFGIGEAPIGLQGTFSLWESGEALRNFAYRGSAHSQAISATKEFAWYSEELFARFDVLETRGEL